jgi:hypothetical protein
MELRTQHTGRSLFVSRNKVNELNLGLAAKYLGAAHLATM